MTSKVEAAFAQHFDPDVSIRLEGNKQDALGLLPQALQLLRRATLFREAGQPVVKMWSENQDGSLLWVYLHGPVRQVYVRPGTKKEVVEAVPVREVTEGAGVVYLMLSGVVRPGTMLDIVSGDSVTEVAHEFHPTQVCANVYDLAYAYQDMAKLGVENPQGTDLQSHYPKPSMYSGAMKRVVQALYGIGITGADTMSTDIGGAGSVTVQNFYKCEWECTHGIFRDQQGVWLIEISKARGVLKMKLPLFDGTEEDSYLDFLVEIGDSDTASIVTEFGGLPNGETFPENTPDAVPPVMALDDAIAAGDVIRLATPEDIAEFYVDSATKYTKSALWSNCCWAFSETGAATSAHNTSFWYSNQGAATIWDYNRADATTHSPMRLELLEYDGSYPLSTVLPLTDRCLRAEHWKITFSGNAATLSAVEKSLFAGQQKTLKAYGVMEPRYELFPLGREWWGRPPSRPSWAPNSTQLLESWRSYWNQDCPIMVMYDGENIDVVRHQPELVYSDGFVYGINAGGPHQAGGHYEPVTESGTIEDYFIEYADPESPGYMLYDYKTHSESTYSVRWSMWEFQRYSYGSYEVIGESRNGLPAQWVHQLAIGTTISTDSGGGTLIQEVADAHPGYTIEGIPYYIDPRNLTHGIFVDEGSSSTPVQGGQNLGYWTITHFNEFKYQRRWSLPWKRAGAFYSAAHDLRRHERWMMVSNRNSYEYSVLDAAAEWEQKIGLVIPSYVREGYLFCEWRGGVDKSNSTTLFLELYDKVVDGPWTLPANVWVYLPEQLLQHFVCPGLGGTIDGPTLDPFTDEQFTNVCEASTLTFAASVNAGPTKCGIAQDGIFASIVVFDYVGGYHTEVITPETSFLGTANGIPVDDCNAKDTTFVGAV